MAEPSVKRRGFLERMCSRHHAFQSVADSSRDVAATAEDTPPTSLSAPFQLSHHDSWSAAALCRIIITAEQ